MILNDKTIKHLCESEEMITPFIPHEVREVNGRKVLSFGLDCFGYNVRISRDELKLLSKLPSAPADPKSPKQPFTILTPSIETSEQGDYIILPTGGCLLAHTIETFKIPSDVFGLVTPKSSYARLFVNAIVTPLQPGWEGQLVLEIINNAPMDVKLYLEEGICQITFLKGDTPYKLYSGVYQGQTGTQEVKI